MTLLAVEPDDALGQLDVLAQSRELPARDAARCAQLADMLRRPARVCLLGSDKNSVDAVAMALLESVPDINLSALPNATEFRYGPQPTAHLTLQDGTTMSHDGWPTDRLLATDPIFMQLELPVEIFRDKSFVMLSLGTDPIEYQPALSWASRRAEIAVWCTSHFGDADSEIWSHVPEHLSHHAYLVEFNPLRPGASHDAFTGTLHLPIGSADRAPQIAPLLQRLNADIDDARVADLDAAQVLLYRLRRFQTNAQVPLADQEEPTRDADLDRIRRVLSGAYLFLQRRVRAMAEDLIWVEQTQADDWAADLLRNAVETAEALRDRAMEWPDDLPQIACVNAVIEEVCDTVTLLQMEGGAARAGDAAALLWQIRSEFLQALYPGGVST